MIIINDFSQGSPEWYKEKLGKPSASAADMIITPQGKQSKQRDGYMYALAAERVSGLVTDSFKSKAMEVGLDREEESRNFYKLINNVEVEQVGLIYKDDKKQFLCSPDGLMSKHKRGLELKNVLPKTQVKYLLHGGLEKEYFVQVQSSLYVTGFDSWDICSYSPGLKPVIITINRDVAFQAALEFELKLFTKELDLITEKIR